jgi:mono/diheme cytochrome c family protein
MGYSPFKTSRSSKAGRPVTEKNIRDQIKTPYKNMPPFADRMNKKEMDQILAYLTTL